MGATRRLCNIFDALANGLSCSRSASTSRETFWTRARRRHTVAATKEKPMNRAMSRYAIGLALVFTGLVLAGCGSGPLDGAGQDEVAAQTARVTSGVATEIAVTTVPNALCHVGVEAESASRVPLIADDDGLLRMHYVGEGGDGTHQSLMLDCEA